ncbi:MAG: hypothetical protein HWQ38_00855 [Nostoc sp. NMS7]|uniref:CU044_2847 family protein n=1 Tax=Nostoc sp. NMS7 TaxID=2815391 RepID=UPI0025DC4358|nr:CU044_2847 family protein [Nostoc sp. NMS7]MBN3945106.1 hypothetical protein [Nostoc sp. NMS7]
MAIIKSQDSVNGEEVTIYIEVDKISIVSDEYGELRGIDTFKVVDKVRDVFGEAMRLTRDCAKRVVQSVEQMDKATRPEEFEIKLAIKLDSEVGAVIAKASTGAQIEVTMKWKPKEQS